ncbi:MAG TPA: type II toxin-antitoxin system VapC family toxin, partial [Terrimesophilobacter sp.]|nr:type II toxin-antitoxin system VapC family toxin [Terrimesophilobacter sp.]
VDWIDQQPTAQLFTTATVIAELAHGIARLPTGKRQHRLVAAFDHMLTTDYLAGVLPFDQFAAVECGALLAHADSTGRPLSLADAQIAAICRVRGATLATRNTKDFSGLGIALIDPWA